MKGLLQKDFYLMRTLARSYAFILGVFFLLSLTGVYDGTFLCTFLVLMCVMIPANTFSYDEQAKWDKYAASLPAGRPGVVRAKYLFTLLVSLAALALAALLQALLFFLGRAGTATLLEAELSAVAPAGFGILMTAILLPLLFRFGSQRGRLYLVLVVAVLTGGTVGGAMVPFRGGSGRLHPSHPAGRRSPCGTGGAGPLLFSLSAHLPGKGPLTGGGPASSDTPTSDHRRFLTTGFSSD